MVGQDFMGIKTADGKQNKHTYLDEVCKQLAAGQLGSCIAAASHPKK